MVKWWRIYYKLTPILKNPSIIRSQGSFFFMSDKTMGQISNIQGSEDDKMTMKWSDEWDATFYLHWTENHIAASYGTRSGSSNKQSLFGCSVNSCFSVKLLRESLLQQGFNDVCMYELD